jgi:hypothetical protein
MNIDKRLLDPRHNDLIPPENAEPELPYDPNLVLVPGYAEEPPETLASTVDGLEAELAQTKAGQCSFDNGLQLQRRLEGGLHVYRGVQIIRDLTELETDELMRIKKYLEG